MRVRWPSTAFIDESLSPRCYLLGAVIVENKRHGALRARARDLQISGTKLHFTKETEARRHEIVNSLVAFRLSHVEVRRTRTAEEGDERARRKCLRRLLWELDQRGVERAVFEARERTQNASDMQLLARLRRFRELRGDLHADHLAGPAEPLLWLADAAAGAVRSHLEHTAQYPELMALVEVVEL